jgi:hypothetical protein
VFILLREIIFCNYKKYNIPHGTVVIGILDIGPGKHDLHFFVDVELLPHAIVNIPNETIHIRVFISIFIIYFIFKKEDLSGLRFKNEDIIPNVESYYYLK